jgi:deoxyribodipyrimidine photo-lyase
MNKPIIVWFRNDLRLADNPALRAAVDSGCPVIPLFIFDNISPNHWPIGAASKWWLHHSLSSLKSELEKKGSHLTILSGSSETELFKLVKATGARSVYWNRRYETDLMAVDKSIKNTLKKQEIVAKSFHSHTLAEPGTVKNKQDKPYQVYGAFWRAYASIGEFRSPLAEPRTITSPGAPSGCCSIDSLRLVSKKQWHSEFPNHWQPGSAGAKIAAREFFSKSANAYKDQRDIPSIDGTSTLSPHLAFGEISAQTLWQTASSNGKVTDGVETFMKQLVWRDFSYSLLFNFPETTHEPLRKEFLNFPWSPNEVSFNAWKKGTTGYPVVDAGMRQLWQTGWMHNRVRMITASFLVKHLLVPWQQGAEWFWDTLLDADLANNTMGWQWTAGCGADAAPYFRIFNPILQGQRFDPSGEYVKRWVPELESLPKKHIHSPWKASDAELRDANIQLGVSYPKPIVDHNMARGRALASYEQMKEKRT